MNTTKATQTELPAVVRRIGQEHKNMSALLDLLERHVAVFESNATPDYELLETLVDYFQRYPDACHHPKEDLIFARLKERSAATALAVGDLPEEHAELARKTTALAGMVRQILMQAEVSREEFEHVARDYIESQRQHMRMEQERFVPAALEALLPEDWVEIDVQITDPEDPIFGTAREERFEALRTEILEWAD